MYSPPSDTARSFRPADWLKARRKSGVSGGEASLQSRQRPTRRNGMREAGRRKPSKRAATSSNGSAAAHTAKRRETLRILTRMSIRPSCGERCPRLRKPSGGGACSHPHTDRCISAPARGRSRSHAHCSHSLAGAAVQRSAAARREVNELALTSKLQSPGRLTPPETALGLVRRRPDVTHPRLKRDFG